MINPPRKGGMPVTESKSADVFAFAMVVVEVFTGKVPFEGQKDEAVVLQISRGGRPAMPTNAQAAGFTVGVWRLLESCWYQNPKKRPTMDEVMRRWETFLERDDDDNGIIIECVKITSVVRASSSQFQIGLGNLNLRQNPHRALVDVGRELRPFHLE